MLSYALFELRKNRDLFWGMAAVFAASLPLAAYGFHRAGIPAEKGVDAALAFWALMGAPLAGLVFGGVSGSSQRSELEAAWPLSPGRRLAGAWLAGLVYAGMLALITAAAGAAFSPSLRGLWSEFNVLPIAGLFCLLQGLTLSLALSYVIGHGVVGGAAALLLTLPVGGASLWWEFMTDMHGEIVDYPAFLVAAVAFLGAALALRRLAPVVAFSRRGWRPWAAGLAFLALGLAAASAASGRSSRRLAHGGQLVQARGGPAEGALLRTAAGELAYLTPDGRRAVLIPRREARNFFVNPYTSYVSDAGWDKDGRLVAVRWVESGAGEVWVGRPPEALVRIHTLARRPDLGWADGRLMLTLFDGEKKRFSTAEPLPGKLRWSTARKVSYFPGWSKYLHEEDGHAWTLNEAERAELTKSKGGKVVESWRLPRTILKGKYVHPWAAAKGGVFWHTGRSVVFVDWQGKQRSLRPAFIGP